MKNYTEPNLGSMAERCHAKVTRLSTDAGQPAAGWQSGDPAGWKQIGGTPLVMSADQREAEAEAGPAPAD